MIRCFLALVAVALAQAQPGPADPNRFAVADVHARPPNSIPGMRRGFSRGVFQLRNATMVDLIRAAWGVDADKVVGGPAWLEMDRFDVVATAPADSSPDMLKTMLRTLLSERFRLVVHRDSRDFPAYALSAGKKLQLEKAPANEEAGCRLLPGAQRPSSRGVMGEPVAYECRGVTMAAFAEGLPKMRGAAGYVFDYPVLDRTGLSGNWNFALHWSMQVPGPTPPGMTELTTLFSALEKQLGLELAEAKVAMPVVVVDSVNQKPTPNLPGVTEKLPSPVAEFEVATIKLANPNDGTAGASVAIQPGGRVHIVMTLMELIQEAWNELGSNRVVGGPKSMETTRFEVRAKAPEAELADGPGVWNGTDINTMRLMLRALLIDRFKLVTHEESRPISGYALVKAHPRLTKADARNRPGCKEGPGADGKDPRPTNPMAARLVTCRNMTVAEFGTQLNSIGVGYLPGYPAVVDAAALKGRYDFTLSFTPFLAFRSLAAARPPGEGVASDPTGAISLFQAVRGQLGLKLEPRKMTGTVLVIDHAEEMPVEN